MSNIIDFPVNRRADAPSFSDEQIEILLASGYTKDSVDLLVQLWDSIKTTRQEANSESPLQSRYQCDLDSEESVKSMAQAIADNFMQREAILLETLKNFSLKHILIRK